MQNFFLLAVSTAARLLTGVVLFVLIARAWEPAVFGHFMYWFTVTALLYLVVDFGFGQKILRDLGRRPEDLVGVMASLVRTKAALALATVVASAAAGWALGLDRADWPVAGALLTAAVALSFAEFYGSPLRALGAYRAEARLVVTANGVHFAANATLAAAGAGPAGVAFGFLATRLVYLGLARAAYRRLGGAATGTSGAVADIPRDLRAGLPYALETGLVSLHAQADTLIVHHLLGPAALGVYQGGLRLLLGYSAFAQVLSGLYLPRLSREHGRPAEFTALARRAVLHSLAVGLAGALLFGLTAGGVVRVFGPQYAALGELLPYFGLILWMRFLASGYALLLTAAGRQIERVCAIALATGVLAAAAWVWVPRFGLTGMLGAGLVAATVLNFVYLGTLHVRNIPAGAGWLASTVVTALIGVAFFLLDAL